MPNAPHQVFLVHSLLIDFLPLRLPPFTKHTLRNLATLVDARRILVIERVHDFVRRHKRLVL